MRILYVLATVPPVRIGGGAVAALLQLQALQHRHELHVVPVLDLEGPRSACLDDLNATLHSPLTAIRSADRLADLTKRIQPDLVEVEAFTAGMWLRFGHASNVPRLFRAYDATWDVLEKGLQSPHNVPVSVLGRLAAAAGIRSALHRHRLRRFRAEEVRRAAEYDEILVFSQRDQLLFSDAGLHSRIVRLPLDPYPARSPPPPSERLRLLFVGTFSYFPNVDAALHLVEDIAPRLPSSLPIAVNVVGHNPPDRLLRHHDGKRIIVHGYVPDLESLYNSTDVFVAPLRFGGGVKLKIMEALARGLAVVTSQNGADGLAVRDGCDVIVRNDPQGTADALRQLHDEPRSRHRLGEAAREYVARHHDVRRTTDELESVYREAILRKQEQR